MAKKYYYLMMIVELKKIMRKVKRNEMERGKYLSHLHVREICFVASSTVVDHNNVRQE